LPRSSNSCQFVSTPDLGVPPFFLPGWCFSFNPCPGRRHAVPPHGGYLAAVRGAVLRLHCLLRHFPLPARGCPGRPRPPPGPPCYTPPPRDTRSRCRRDDEGRGGVPRPTATRSPGRPSASCTPPSSPPPRPLEQHSSEGSRCRNGRRCDVSPFDFGLYPPLPPPTGSRWPRECFVVWAGRGWAKFSSANSPRGQKVSRQPWSPQKYFILVYLPLSH